MDYVPPNNTNIYFEFKDIGYNPPNPTTIVFNVGTASKKSDITASITGLELKYNYLKSKDVYVLGYNVNRVQIIKSNYIYGGIRKTEYNKKCTSN